MKKTFDLEAAKNGAKVVTRDGRPVEILKYNYKYNHYPIIGVVTNKDGSEVADCFTKNGNSHYLGYESFFDLFIEEEQEDMLTEKDTEIAMEKEFDIDAAKAGAKVTTRDGRSVKILYYDYKNDTFPIIALVTDNGEEILQYYKKDGRWMIDDNEKSPWDLITFKDKTKKYRPYKNSSEMDVDIMKKGHFVINKTELSNRFEVLHYTNNYVKIHDHLEVKYEDFVRDFTWLDGTPCGVLDE